MISTDQIKEVLSSQSNNTFLSKDSNLEFEFWSIDDIDVLNQSYGVNEFIPGYFGIGSDGGDEMLTVELSSGKVYSIPFIPMDSKEKVFIANSLDDLIKETTTHQH